MAQYAIFPLALDSATKYITHPPTPGELVGGVIGSTYGPLGAFLGGTVGRMLEKTIFN